MTNETDRKEDQPTESAVVAPELPVDVAAALLGTEWAESINEVRPRY